MMFTKYKRGMVYWCDLPRYEKNANVQAGNRPVIIVSNDVANCLSNNITIIPVTTNIEKNPDQPTHTIITLNPREDSLVLAEDIITVNKNLLGGFMGMLDDKTMEKINKCIMAAVGLCEIPNPFDREMPKKSKTEILEETAKQNKGRRVSGPAEQMKFLNFYEQHTIEETMAEYGVPTKSAVHQRVQWYKQKLNIK